MTPWGCLKDLGVVDRVNAFILPFDMSEIPVKAIYKGLKKFKYEIRPDSYGKYLAPGKGNYEEEMNKMVKIRCKQVYFDLQLDRMIDAGEEWEVKGKRAEVLQDLGVVDIIEE